PSSRRFPYINFKPERECGKNILEVNGITHSIDGEIILRDFSLYINKGDKIAFVGPDHLAKTILFQILTGEIEPDKGSYEWGVTIKNSYYPKENTKYFENDYNLTEWLGQYSTDADETYIRSFLGRMLFSGEDGLKSARVLSGGEKVRCMMAKIMQEGSNVLVFDEPTNHLDLEAITALNDGLIDFPESILMTSHDHQFIDTIANRIIEFTPQGVIDKYMRFDDYLNSDDVKSIRDNMYKNHNHNRLTI
ncbi:MAG: ABC-F family ATP-binding cassette domain-containing protein, partial [Spirochaetales bacterium]|nr:ABC-F family ATP-binding cassette domain-containing protein [Spirochaetales bacterium]